MATRTEQRDPAVSDAEATREVARRYFEAVAARDLDAIAGSWPPGKVDRMVGEVELSTPDGVRDYFAEVFAAFPDFSLEVVDTTAEEDRCAVEWRATGTFAGPGSFQGIEPNGARIEIEGCDLVRVSDGALERNDAYLNGSSLVRQLGLLPAKDSPGEQRLTRVFNTRTRVARRLIAREPEAVAEGVWLIRGGLPSKTMNVYLIEDEGQVTVFDAGTRQMTRAVAAAAVRLGGIRRVVLGHAHHDHRGAAAGLGAPIFCHPADRADAEGDGGEHYFDYSQLDFLARFVMPRLLHWWDCGPLPIEGTVSEGDEIAGFRVIHLPGHAPGLIGLWRESDRLALATDCFYTLDPQTGRKGHPRVPHAAFNADTELARESIRKLAALEPAAAWPGHMDPLTGDVRAQLEQAAATT